MKSFACTARCFALGLIIGSLTAGYAYAERDQGRGGGGGNGGGQGGSAMGSGGGPHAGPSQHAGPSASQSHVQGATSNAAQHGDEHQSFFRGPGGDGQNGNDARDSNRDQQRLGALANGNNGANTDRNGDFRGRFTDRDQSDRNGEQFRRNADSIRHEWRDRGRGDFPFVFGWWNDDRFSSWPIYSPWRYSYYQDRPWFWWQAADASRLGSWLAFSWSQPYYWDYGPNGYIYYRDNQVYQNGQPYMAGDQYYQQVYQLAHSAPAISEDEAAKIEWMPLGAFAVTQEGKAQSNRMVQLALSKQGVLSGTYYNQQTNVTHPLQGMVDQKTQRTAWVFADGSDDKLVMETSIYNLTEPQSTVMVHFSPESVGIWQLVRLEQPDSSGNSGARSATPQQNDLP